MESQDNESRDKVKERRHKQFYKVLNGIDQIEWKNELLKTIKGEENGPVASNLRKKGLSFHRKNAKTSSLREKFFLNWVIPP